MRLWIEYDVVIVASASGHIATIVDGRKGVLIVNETLLLAHDLGFGMLNFLRVEKVLVM